MRVAQRQRRHSYFQLDTLIIINNRSLKFDGIIENLKQMPPRFVNALNRAVIIGHYSRFCPWRLIAESSLSSYSRGPFQAEFNTSSQVFQTGLCYRYSTPHHSIFHNRNLTNGQHKKCIQLFDNPPMPLQWWPRN